MRPDCVKWLPDDREVRKAPKLWCCNILATVVGQPFVDYIESVVQKRD